MHRPIIIVFVRESSFLFVCFLLRFCVRISIDFAMNTELLFTESLGNIEGLMTEFQVFTVWYGIE